ncbi:glycosyltransferase [Halorussus halophilus]|uniref:glycosyltransferase n=1 Tax=Halorussus halophilus TaxID=2650975 RepID=UPI001300FF91|nr:glycosyltransferase [Halorussus halophilus]
MSKNETETRTDESTVEPAAADAATDSGKQNGAVEASNESGAEPASERSEATETSEQGTDSDDETPPRRPVSKSTTAAGTAKQASEPTRAVVLPIYDEPVESWVGLVEELLAADWDEVVVCADDPGWSGSKALRDIDGEERVTLSVSDDRRGKGGALIDGLDASDADVIGFVDADGAIDVQELACLYRVVESGDADVAIGSRGISRERRAGQSTLRRAFAAGYSALARRATGVPVRDFQCGAKAFTREAWESVTAHNAEEGFSFDTELVARLYHRGFTIREVSIEWNDSGDSDVQLKSDVPKMLSSLQRIRRTRTAAPGRASTPGSQQVAMVSCHPPLQGHLSEYCEALATELGARDDVDLTVLAQCSDDAPSVEHRDDYVVRRVWQRDSARGTASLLRELVGNDYDVVHFNIHMTYFGTKNRYRFAGLALPPLISRLSDASVVTTLHDLLEVVDDQVVEEEIGVMERLGAVAATQMVLLGDATTVTSEEYLDVVTSRYQAPDVRHVPHGTFRTASERAAGERTTTELPDLDAPLRIMVFGHLGPTKDVETMVEAMEFVHEEVPDAELWIAGDSHPGYPGYREQLEKKFSGTPGVRFTGYVEDHEMDELWESASLLAMPYRTCTGVSGVFQLAKSYGRPVLAFDVEGMRTATVETGGSASFVPEGRPEEIASRIVELWDDRERLTEMASENAAASDEFTMADAAERFAEVYGECQTR